MTVLLKKFMGEAGALLSDSTGFNKLYDVLKELIEGGPVTLPAYQATIATATIAAMVADRVGVITSLRTAIAVCGTADNTTVQVHVNGSSKGELTTAHDDDDGTKKALALTQAVAVGDLIEIVVSAAPTAGSDLNASVRISPDITVE